MTASDPLAESTWIALLHLNHAEVAGVRRLDQQLIYVPLAALAAAITAVAGNRVAYQNVGVLAVLLVIMPVAAVFVGLGLWRNHARHCDLLRRRDVIMRGLGQPPLKLDWASAPHGGSTRALPGGWIVGGWVLIRLL